MEKKYLFFDLDGTLTDPKVGITKSVQLALASFGIVVEDLDSLCPFIGPPLRDSFKELYHLSEEQADQGIIRFREYFETKGLYENRPYEGIEKLLGRLKEAGYCLMVATSKPERPAKLILQHFHMDHFFDFIGGADDDEIRVEKADVIRYVMRENGISDPKQVLMIGDRKHDILGARENGVDSIGVLYGYGSLEELRAAGAGRIAASLEELETLLL